MGWNEAVFVLDLLAAGVALVLAARLGRVWLTALIVVCSVLMNLVVMMQMTLFGLAVTGGNVLYGAVFLANDTLNEHYGPAAARQAVLVGFGAALTAVVLGQIAILYVPNAFDDARGHLAYFFSIGAYPRIVAASMLSYLLAQMLDTHLYHRIRGLTGASRGLWLRSNASSWTAQAFDTVFFTTAGLTGTVVHSWLEWRDAVLFAFALKVLVAVLDTPFLYLTTWGPLRPPGSIRGARSGVVAADQ